MGTPANYNNRHPGEVPDTMFVETAAPGDVIAPDAGEVVKTTTAPGDPARLVKADAEAANGAQTVRSAKQKAHQAEGVEG